MNYFSQEFLVFIFKIYNNTNIYVSLTSLAYVTLTEIKNPPEATEIQINIWVCRKHYIYGVETVIYE